MLAYRGDTVQLSSATISALWKAQAVRWENATIAKALRCRRDPAWVSLVSLYSLIQKTSMISVRVACNGDSGDVS